MKFNNTKKRRIQSLKGGNYMAKDIYGTMVIPKDSILYHSSFNKFKANSTKPMLFLTFHPSDWYEDYVTKIKLNRDIQLLFMVSPNNSRVPILYSLLNTLINKPGHNLNKQNNTNLKCYVKKLQSENLDGWFSTIERTTPVEVSIINDSTIYSVVESERYNNNMINSYTTQSNTGNYINIPTNWGTKYPISTLLYPLQLKINSIYKQLIHDIQQYTKENGIFFAIQVIFLNANITFFDKDIPKIVWDC